MTATVLMVPGVNNSGPGHWQTIWQEKHPELLTPGTIKTVAVMQFNLPRFLLDCFYLTIVLPEQTIARLGTFSHFNKSPKAFYDDDPHLQYGYALTYQARPLVGSVKSAMARE